MKKSILRTILFAFLGFGIAMGVIFPFYAGIFVEFKEGMYSWFVIGCLVAGIIMGVFNYYLLNFLLINKLKEIAQVATSISNNDLSFSCNIQSNDVIGEIINSFNKMAETLRKVIGEIQNSSEQMLTGMDRICQVAHSTNEGVQRQHNETQLVEHSIQNMTQIAQDVSSKAAQQLKPRH